MEEIQEPQVARMCSRNPENPSDRGKSNGRFVQMLELKHDGTSNTLTSVQKDNLVCEPIIYDDYNRRIPKNQDYIGTITTNIGSPTPRNGYKLIIPEATAKGYAEATDGDSVNLEQPNSKTRRGRVGKQMANTLTTSCNQGVVVSDPTKDTATTICLNSKVDGKQPSLEHRIYDSSGISTAITTGFHPSVATLKYRIRKLTPRECFRLMDVDENVIDTIQAAGISNSQQYKMAGNSIVVACLYGIFEQLFFPKYTNSGTLF